VGCGVGRASIHLPQSGAMCERYVYSLTFLSVVRYIQACPPALSEFQSHRSGRLSAAGLSLSSPHPYCKLSLSFLCCFVLQPHIMGGYGRQIHASVCERYVYSGTLFSLRKRRIVNFIQACPPALE
jgi:hypothetical protein